MALSTLTRESPHAVEFPFAAATTHPPAVHLRYIDGLRALAALYVLLCHAALEVWPIKTSHLVVVGPARWILYALSFGNYAVSVFIVISGFCLMLPVVRNGGRLKGGAWLFYKKRARRILPPYYLAMVLSLLLIGSLIGRKTGTHWDSSLPVTPGGIAAHLLLLQDFYGSPQINHVFWSIALEWHIYFLFPLLVLLWRRWDGLKATLAVVFLSLVGLHLLPPFGLKEFRVQYFGLFAEGALGAVIAFSREERWAFWRRRAPWGVLICLFAVIAGVLDRTGRDWYADYALGIAAMGTLILASQPDGRKLHAFLSISPLAATGLFAYSIYLIHAPLLQVVWQYLLHPLHLSKMLTFALLIGVGAPLIVGISYLFYLFCERPFLTQRPNPSPLPAREAANAI